MTVISQYWPYAITLGVFGLLLYHLITGRVRPALPVVVAPGDDRLGVETLAELVRSGTFYVNGSVLDWELCCEFATIVIRQRADESQDSG